MTRVTQAEFARMAGVNRSTVHRWIQNGRIETDAHGLIDPDTAARMREATESPLPHHQARKAQFDESRQGVGQGVEEKMQQPPQPGATMPPATEGIGKDEVTHRRNVAVMLEREWMAKQREIEARKAAGELYERVVVREAWSSAFIVLRSALESLPDRAAAELSRHHGDTPSIHNELSGMMADVLREVADHFKRRIERQDGSA
jgi:hypothetical protein